jgi:hypothetical protein
MKNKGLTSILGICLISGCASFRPVEFEESSADPYEGRWGVAQKEYSLPNQYIESKS